MDSNNINYNEEVLKGGLIVAGVSILVTMLTYIINVELMVAWWYGLIALAISMGLVIYIGISLRNAIGGYMSYKESLKFTFLVLTVSYLVGAIFNILLYKISINIWDGFKIIIKLRIIPFCDFRVVKPVY